LIFIKSLLKSFHKKGIRYVHWKSNTNIDDALSGIDDLDLLVHPEDKVSVEKIFQNLGILRAISSKDNWQKDIYHFIGVDIDQRLLVHIHMHYSLTIGYDYDKKFTIPVTTFYLENPIVYEGILLPEIEKEYIVLVIRLILKNEFLPFFLHLPTRQLSIVCNAKCGGVVRGNDYKEFLNLKKQIDPDRVKQYIETGFKFLTYELFLVYEKTLRQNTSVISFFKAGRKLKKELKEFGNKSELKSIYFSFLRINHTRFSNLKKRLYRIKNGSKLPGNGGRIIAFVGGDGAGKTTNIKTLRKILSAHFFTNPLHVGRPPKSLQGLFWKILTRAAHFFKFKNHGLAFAQIAIAFDRKNIFLKACKLREKGHVVLLDRIPLPGISAMDCPRVHMVEDGKFLRLARFEKRLYKKIKGVDLLFVLKLNPKTALKRRPEDNPAELMIRSGQIWNNDWDAPYAIEIDTGINGIVKIEREILQKTWDCLNQKFFRTEILGLSGAGKSTLIKEIQNHIPNTAVSIPFWDHPFLLIKSIVLGFPLACKAWSKSHNFQVGVNWLQFLASFQIIECWEKSGKVPSKNFVFDQGPVFQLVLMLKEGLIDMDIITRKKIKKLNGFLDLTFFVDADRKILFQRINKRTHHIGRGKGKDWNEFNLWCNEYQTAFNNVLSFGIDTYHLKSDSCAPLALFEAVQDQLNDAR
jgi:thymidylate kinase